MRFVCALLLAFLGVESVSAFPRLTIRTYVKSPTHPDNAIIEILIWLYEKSTKEEKALFKEKGIVPGWWCKYRFFHFLSVSDEDLYEETQNFRCYLPMANGYSPSPPKTFPIDKDGRVWVVNRFDLGWSAEAFHEVTKLDKTCTEPHINHDLADELRRAIGVKQDVQTFHCEGLLPAPWFIRQLQETDQQADNPESIVYYNLLYSKERFGEDFDPKGHVVLPEPQLPKPRVWQGGYWPPGSQLSTGGRFYPKDDPSFRNGWNTEDEIKEYHKALEEWKKTQGKSDGTGKKNGFIDRNFPRTAEEFEERWGSKASLDFLKKQKVFKKNGTVIAGAFNDPKNGSYVAINDRVNYFTLTPFGLAMDTQDFKRTSGKRNPANLPLEVALRELDEDASEKIHQKQDDFPAFFLAGARKDGAKRVEFGDPHVVFDKANGGNTIVQTLHKCIGCHYPSDVVLAPSNEKVVEAIKRRNELLAYSDYDRQILDSFYNDNAAARGGWQRKIKAWREPYAFSLAGVTVTTRDKEGWKGARFASVSNGRRDMYDYPVTLNQAAAELGYPRLAVVIACTIEGSIDAGNLLLEAEPGVPRAAWDDDLFYRLAKILAIAREAENPDPLLALFFPELIRQTNEKLFYLKKRE